MGTLFNFFLLLIPVALVAVAGLFAFKIIQGIAGWLSNNAQPVRTVPALVITKRQHVSGGGPDSFASTSYYLTFETVADGLRQEFHVGSADYSGLAEGDTGDLTYQGTRYQGFVRVRRPVTAAARSPVTS